MASHSDSDTHEDDLENEIFKSYGNGAQPPNSGRPVVKQEEEVGTPNGRARLQKGPRRAAGGTPARPHDSPANYTDAVTLSASKNYGSRSGRGDVIFRYNCSDSSSWTSSDNGSEWDIQLFSPEGSVPRDAKFMFQKTRDMAIAMNRSIHHLAMSIIDENDLEGYQNLKESTTEDAVFVGRIRGDGNGKLTAGSVFFEGTLESSNGHVVSLDLSSLEECFLFPGQVVAIGGTNNLGKCVVVKNIFSPRPLPFPEAPLKIDRNTGPLNVLVAAGPFTPSDSLCFEAFEDLTEKIKETKPDVCILIGPFLDESHELISEFVDNQDMTFETFFRKKIKHLCDLGTGTKFVLVSSSRDVHHLPVYPAPPYNLQDSEGSVIKIDQELVTSVPDPALISINGLVIGVTATDILMHMHKSILAHATIHTDRFSRIARELLNQRNFYPLYPPNENVPMDVGLQTKYGQMEATPHILILPSELNHFIKDVDQTVVLNPGRLSAGRRTYARLHIEVPSSATYANSVADIMMGEIVKI